MTSASDTKQIIEGHKLLGEVLARDPKHQGALLIRGDSAYRIGMYDLAIASWQALKSGVQSNPQMINALDERIRMATARNNGEVSENQATSGVDSQDKTENTTLNEASRPGVSVQIQIAEQLMDRLDGNEDIFIFARAASGPPFPIAVVKTKVGDLMGPIVLNDSQAMQAQYSLSKFDEITISARISFSGNATASTGDIQGSIAAIKRPFPAEPITLVLDQVVE